MRAWGELDDYVDAMIDRTSRQFDRRSCSRISFGLRSDGDRLNLGELKQLVSSLLMAGTDTPETNWRRRYRCSASIRTNGRGCATIRSLRWGRSRRACVTRQRSAVAPRAAVDDVEFGGYLFPAGTIRHSEHVCSQPRSRRSMTMRIALTSRRDDVTRNSDVRRRRPLLPGGEPRTQVELAEALTILTHRLPDCPTRRSCTVEIAPGDDRSDKLFRLDLPAKGL